MTAATTSDALLDRATKQARNCSTAVRAYGETLQAARAEPDLVDRMKNVARMVLAAEQSEAVFKALAEDARAALCEVMSENGIGVDIGTHSVYVVAKEGTVRITDPAAIPPEYMRQPPAAPDKEAIKAAIKKGAEIPGAVVSGNGSPTIAFRTKKVAA